MIYSHALCVASRLQRGKTSVLLATAQAPLKMLAWTVLSFLLRSKPGSFTDMFVCLSGPDHDLLDQKQGFLKSLELPNLTLIRVDGPSGHPEGLEACLTWAKGEFFVHFHDDIILLKDWSVDTLKALEDESVAYAYHPPLRRGGFYVSRKNYYYMLNFPHPNLTFVAGRRVAMIATEASWFGSCITHPIILSEEELARLETLHELQEDQEKPRAGVSYNTACMDIGSYMYHGMKEAGYTFAPLPDDLLVHFLSSSWSSPEMVEEKVRAAQSEIDRLVLEINASPYAGLYHRYVGGILS